MNALLPTTKQEAEEIISRCTFLPMDQMDHMVFSGIGDEFGIISYTDEIAVIQTPTDTIFIDADEYGLCEEVRFNDLK